MRIALPRRLWLVYLLVSFSGPFTLKLHACPTLPVCVSINKCKACDVRGDCANERRNAPAVVSADVARGYERCTQGREMYRRHAVVTQPVRTRGWGCRKLSFSIRTQTFKLGPHSSLPQSKFYNLIARSYESNIQLVQSVNKCYFIIIYFVINFNNLKIMQIMNVKS